MNYNFKKRKVKEKWRKITKDFHGMFSDHEVKVLLLWALIGPFMALAYIVWIRYPKLRWVSGLFVIVNIVYLVAGIGGLLFITYRFLR